MEQIPTPETKLQTKLRQANAIPNWDTWKGIPERAEAQLTDDIYAYETENPRIGKGLGIKYGDMHFFYKDGILVNSSGDRITAEELKTEGNSVIAQQLNELIEKALNKEKPLEYF
jgi:hypothetical protein